MFVLFKSAIEKEYAGMLEVREKKRWLTLWAERVRVNLDDVSLYTVMERE